MTDADEAGAGPAPAIEPNGPGEPGPFRVNASLAPSYRGDTTRMLTDVRGWLADGWRVVLVTEGHGPAQRLAEMLRGEDIGARLQDVTEPPEAGVPYVTTARIGNGFVWPAARLALLTESDLAGTSAGLPSTRDMRRMPSRRRGGVDPLQLKPGDYVVHEQHGVGRYVEMTSRTAAGATREYLVIEYAPGRRGQPPDRLYVPTDQLDEVTRYSGGEAPTLHRLGGADWAKAKGRARKAVRQIASELIRLYSARMASPGFAFGPDTPWQRELEDAFPYVETPDQLGAIDEVKRRHGTAGADGPADLRGRRLRQDRDRGPRRVQGGAGRQAGRGAGADHAAGAAAPLHVLRALRPVPGEGAAAVPVPGQAPRRTRPCAAWPTAPWTWSSARTSCCPRRPGSPGSAW